MKKIIFSLLFLFMLQMSFGQTYHVTYYGKAKDKSNNPAFNRFGPDMKQKVKELLDNLDNVYRLVNKNGHSKFYYDYALVKGEIDKDPRRYVNKRIFYKDFSEGTYFYEWLDQRDSQVKYKTINTGWKIDATRDTVIAGFDCKFATLKEGENSVFAWFAPAIPIMDGPYWYAGLPGLIIRLETAMEVFQVQDIKVVDEENGENEALPKKE